MKRALAATALAALLGVGAWQAAEALQNEAAPPQPVEDVAEPAEQPAQESSAQPRSRGEARRAEPGVRAATPMAERVAVIGLLNKRNGISRDIEMKPGQAVRSGDVIIRLRACETTAPWEPQQLTGAFVQTDVRGRDNKWRRVFSGWLYKESPSLNMVQHPIYDVWPKSCTMRHPETGPDTVSAGSGGNRSSAKKSGKPAAAEDAAPAAAPATGPAAPSAASSNDT
ncbi:hypothetical protein SAMN06295912_105126 [Sphingomonas laterariae]|uniref:DUF2155 domain-containing protein n=1 Tax=Edaphosphingomonas laterariae TaxID=861865 RepID=A0A239DYZ3_9SPHN|nr:hypothetical protein SAMN06295912_105126 [Sphingomonas laterariae]